MGLDEDRVRLIEAARALVARDEAKFTISAVCAKAGVDRAAFHRFFSGKRGLLAALEAPAAPEAQFEPQAEVPVPAPEPQQPELKAPASEAGFSPDAWLERRLRVFERALAALEAKAELDARAQAAAIARLEEKLAGVQAPPHAVMEEMPRIPEQAPEPVAPPLSRPMPDLLVPTPRVMAAPSKEEMAEVLQAARARTAPPPEPPRRRLPPLRWLAVGAVTAAVLIFWAGLTLGYSAGAHAPGQGVSHRRMATGAARILAQADAGDPRAQLQLALSYLRGGDNDGAERWSVAAAQSGLPVAQYLAGALMPDKARAFTLFRAAAGQGNLKAMHNLAIAYAQGQGTGRNENQAADWFARAAAHGYVDSAFDLAVLYERGLGVKQDLQQALKWYSIAALAGDAPSGERADVLRGQLKPVEVRLAEAAAHSFSPLPVAGVAN